MRSDTPRFLHVFVFKSENISNRAIAQTVNIIIDCPLLILRFVTERLGFLDGLAELFRVALLKVECFGDILIGKGQVTKDTDHVALLAVVLLIAVVVDDVLLSILEAHRDVIEVSDVHWIGQQVVPSQTLHGLLGNLGVLELVQEFVVRERELVVLLKVLALLL